MLCGALTPPPVGYYSLYVGYCRRSVGYCILYAYITCAVLAVASYMSDVAAYMRDTQQLCGMFHPLCGMLQPACRRSLKKTGNGDGERRQGTKRGTNTGNQNRMFLRQYCMYLYKATLGRNHFIQRLNVVTSIEW